MKVHKHRPIKYGDKVTFKGIEKKNYYKEISMIDEKLRKDMHLNQVAENISKLSPDNDAIYSDDDEMGK